MSAVNAFTFFLCLGVLNGSALGTLLGVVGAAVAMSLFRKPVFQFLPNVF